MKVGTALAAFSLAGGLLCACTPSQQHDSKAASASASNASASDLRHELGEPALSDVPDDVSQFLEGNKDQQLSYYRIGDGMRMATANEHEPRPALSLIKLYIATYVLEKGSFEDKYEALDMIASSSDTSAEELFEKYPNSIDSVAKEYGLQATKAGDQWGTSVTSMYDVVRFVVQLKEDNPTHPVLVAMAHADPISEDGYEQDYGTAKLQNVVGTKWGWSNDKTLHSSVSFGKNFVVAATTYGSADDLTDFVKDEVTGSNLRKGTDRYQKALNGESVAPVSPSKPSTPASKTTITVTSTLPKSEKKGSDKDQSKDGDKAKRGDKSKEPTDAGKKSAEKKKDKKKEPTSSAQSESATSKRSE